MCVCVCVCMRECVCDHQVALTVRIFFTLSVHPYRPSLPVGPTNYTQWYPYGPDVCKFLLVSQH